MDDKEPKKLNDDLITFMKKRSESEVPRYAERLKNYVNLQNRRAAASKRHSDQRHDRKGSAKARDPENKEADNANSEQQGNDEGRVGRRGRKECMHGTRTRTGSRSLSGEPVDRCGRRRRRRRSCRRKRRRRRSCGRRRRRRRRSCGRRRRRRRRSCRRRRRRSRSRRRRRRSCRRKRRGCRRKRRRRC